MKAYIYNVETMEVVAILNGDQDQIESYGIDSDMQAITYSPAFGCVDGLIENDQAEEINV